MRGIPIARFGGKFNSSKAKVFMLLIPETHKGHWLRPRQVHDTLGIPLGSLLVLMAKWSGPDWRKLQRRKKDGYFEYQSTSKGEKWFFDWQPFMPISRYKEEIRQWQEKQRPTNKE